MNQSEKTVCGVPTAERRGEDYLVVKDLVKTFGNNTVVDHVSFSIEKGEMVTLLGPSGCGKSTTLRCIAGLESLDGGEILIGDQIVSSTEKGFSLAPEKRDIGMVFQSYAVWPHMTVWGNVAYPLEVRRFPRHEINPRVQQILEMVGLADMAQRNVTKLSGGQQQRVVVARALVFNPRILLLDEPLSNLDARLRESMRFEIRRIQQDIGITAIYVTHDQAEAMVLSDRVIVMNRGKIEQVGCPMDIYRQPSNAFVATFFGEVNLIEGTIASSEDAPQTAKVKTKIGEEYRLVSARLQPGMKAGDEIFVCVRPEDIDLSSTMDELTTENTFSGKVSRVIQMGSHVEYLIDLTDQHLSCRRTRDLNLEEGSAVRVLLNPDFCICVAR